ncbi:MAG: hypothetical protein H6R18_704 [Proteobacteria bacterium]|nr:hypothetical protein [Pseudomonadota bacterium]
MSRPVSEVMTAAVVTVDTQDTLDKVEEVMDSHHLTSVPVVDSKGVVFGVISACDLVRFHNMHKNLKSQRAWEMCTYKPLVVAPTASSVEVANMMVDKRIHHVLVVEDGRVTGIVSSLDLIERHLLKNGDR